MVLSTHKELIFKGSKKQHQILAQTAYYQAGKIVIQTILPEQPPVALITLNTLGTTCSTSADTYIPIENISNTQSCSFLESRLVSLYGGKAASLLIEYQQLLSQRSIPWILEKMDDLFIHSSASDAKQSLYPRKVRGSAKQIEDVTATLQKEEELRNNWVFDPFKSLPRKDTASLLLQNKKLKIQVYPVASEARRGAHLKAKLDVEVSTKRLADTCLAELARKVRSKHSKKGVRTYFAGAGNNIFQSTLGNVEIQTATHLARIMVNYWNFYSLNKTFPRSVASEFSIAKTYGAFSKIDQVNRSNKLISPYSSPQKLFLVKSLALQNKSKMSYSLPLSHLCKARRFVRSSTYPHKLSKPFVASYARHVQLRYFARSKTAASYAREALSKTPATYALKGSAKQIFDVRAYEVARRSTAKDFATSFPSRYTGKRDAQREYNVKLWGKRLHIEPNNVKLKGKDKKPKEDIINVIEKNLHFAISQSKNSLKICENKNSSYNIRRLSIEKIGDYPQLNNNTFQLISSIQFSNLQRNRFYPNWFRLYLPDIEATEFFKNVANYYFSLGLQTLTFPFTKSSNVANSTPSYFARPFFSFLNKNTLYSKAPATNAPQPATCSTCLAQPVMLLPAKQGTEKQSKGVAKQVFFSNRTSCTYCPPSILVNYASDKCIPFASLPSLPLSKALTLRFAKGSACQLSFGSKAQQIEDVTASLLRTYHKIYSDVSLQEAEEYSFATPADSQSQTKQKGSKSKIEKQKRGLALVKRLASQSWLKVKDLNFTKGPQEQLNLYSPSSSETSCFNPSISSALRSWQDVTLRQALEGLPFVAGKGLASKGQLAQQDVSCKALPTLKGSEKELLLENQIFPLNYNGFSLVEKELLYDALVNSCFAKAFSLINQNRQLLDFLVDYLLRFQILRQHQILYLFSTLLIGCNKR